MRRAFSSLRARVLLLIAILFVVMFGMTVYRAFGEREARLAEARRHVLDTARVMAGAQQRIVEHVHEVLFSVMMLPEVRRGVASKECNRALAARLKQEPSLVNISSALADGDVVCQAIPTAPRASLADEDFFKLALQTREFSLGDYAMSRTTGAPRIGFAYPELDDAGAPRAVVAATLSLAWLGQELAKVQLPAGSRVAVVDGAGVFIALHPDSEALVGKSAGELPLWRKILIKGGEGVEEDTGPGGRAQIFGFAPVHRTASGQAYLWAAIPKDVVVEPAERAFVSSLLVELALLVLTLGAVWLGSESLFVRRIAALTRAAKELGEGNLATRVKSEANSDEIGQLAQSFDRMAERLQTKETQRSRAVSALRVLSASSRVLAYGTKGEQQLLEKMCRAIGGAGRYRLVWVAYAENDTQRSIRPVAHSGDVPEGYFENLKLTWSETEGDRTPPDKAIRTGMPVVARSIQSDAVPQAWQDYALRFGCGACLVLPLRIDERVIGVLNICATETDAFSDEEIKLLSETAGDLSFGLAKQRTEAEHAGNKRSLKTAEERFRAAAEANLDALFIAICVRDKTGRILDFEVTDINDRAAELLAVARDRVVGRKLCEMLPFSRTAGLIDKYAQVVAMGTPLEEDLTVDTPELETRWLRHQVVRVDDGIAIFARDITPQKEAGIRLMESEERLRLATKAAHMGAWSWDLKSNSLSCSEQLGPVFGLPPGNGFRTPEELVEAVHSADRDRFACAITEGRENGTSFRIEFRTIWPHGSLHWVECRSDFIRDAQGVPQRGAGFAMDITERKRVEDGLRESEETVRTLAASAQDAILMLDNDENIAFWNAAAERIFGFSGKEAHGKNLHHLLTPARFRVAAEAGFRRFKLTGEGALIGKTLELAALRKDGTEFPMEISLSGLKLKDKWTAVGIIRDITQRKAGELELIRSNRALCALSACNKALLEIVHEPELFDAICQLIVNAGSYSMAWIGAAEQDAEKTVRVVAKSGVDKGYLGSVVLTWADTEEGRWPTGTAIRTGATKVNQSFLSNHHMGPWHDEALARGFQSSIAMPLKGPSGIFAALTVYAPERDAFNAAEVQHLEELANNLAFGIAKLRTGAERGALAQEQDRHAGILRKSLEESVRAISNTVQMRDPGTAVHQKRVAELAAAIATDMGLPKDKIQGTHLAASVHDLGNMQVPAELFSKPGMLSDIEHTLLRTHVHGGYSVLRRIEFPWPIADIVLQHHERLDGSGYPQGLKGNDILMEARIVAVADVFEVMASHRSYRPARGVGRAMSELEEGRGTLYDPVVADACLKLFRQERFAFQA